MYRCSPRTYMNKKGPFPDHICYVYMPGTSYRPASFIYTSRKLVEDQLGSGVYKKVKNTTWPATYVHCGAGPGFKMVLKDYQIPKFEKKYK